MGWRGWASALAIVIGAAGAASAQGPAVSDVSVAAPAAGATSAEARASIRNPSMYDLYIISATADVAARVEFREGSGAAAKVVKELTVPAYGSVDLSPAGTHLVLVDLTRALAAGETVTLTFKTDTGVTLTAKAPVVAP